MFWHIQLHSSVIITKHPAWIGNWLKTPHGCESLVATLIIGRDANHLCRSSSGCTIAASQISRASFSSCQSWNGAVAYAIHCNGRGWRWKNDKAPGRRWRWLLGSSQLRLPLHLAHLKLAPGKAGPPHHLPGGVYHMRTNVGVWLIVSYSVSYREADHSLFDQKRNMEHILHLMFSFER